MLARTLLLFVFLCGTAQAFPFGKSASSVTPTAETVTANLSSTGVTIPASFVGFSWENDAFINGQLEGSSCTSLAGSISLLGGSGVMRIGGNSADANPAPALTSTLANNLATCLSSFGSGWSLIYSLPFMYGTGGNSTTATTQAGYLINAIGVNNVVFQTGNEQNPSAGYTTEWNNYYAAVTTAYPGALFGGPDTAAGESNANIESMVNSYTPGVSGIQFVSQHFYQGGGYFDTPTAFLNFVIGSSYNSLASFAGTGKLRWTEYNTMSDDNAEPGISNVLLASAWYININAILATEGFQGSNLHQADLCPNPFDTCHNENPAGIGKNTLYAAFILQSDGGWTPSPVFYGMLLFSKLEGQVIASTSKSGSGNVTALATVGAHGNANILVTNNDQGTPVTVTPAQSVSGWTTAKVWNVGSRTNAWCQDTTAQLNGQAIGEGGTNAAGPTTISNGGTVTIVPCGAALIEIQP